MDTRSRGWTVTVNNYTDNDVIQFEELSIISSYMCYSKEVAPKTNTPHLQGYVYFDNAKTFKKLQKILPKGSHIEVAKGSALVNRIYCGADIYEKEGKIKQKNETFKEFGTVPAQGKRSDLQLVKDEIISGSGMGQIIEIASNYQSLKTAELLLKYKEQKRKWKPEVLWFYGESGCGKTKTVYEMAPEVYRKTNSTGKWWEGYDAHPDVLLDDLKDTSKDMYSTLLELLDRYDCRVETKGGSRQFLAKRIYITSILHPRDLFSLIDPEIKELKRRIDNIIHVEDSK